MSLHIVPDATFVPGYCAATGTTTGPFVDTGAVVREADARIYLSVAYLESAAVDLGFLPASEVETAEEDRDTALTVVAELAERVEGFDAAVTNTTEAMVLFLAETRARADLIDELRAAREAVGVLTERVAALETS